MNYKIVRLKQFSGRKASIYSVLPENKSTTIFEKFVFDFETTFPDEILSILDLLEDMNQQFGIQEHLLKTKEGRPGDGVIAIYDSPGKKLRLYGIRFGSALLILGGGGEKLKGISAWQHDHRLSAEANLMIKISQDIYLRIKEKEIFFSEDQTTLLGNLIFNDEYFQ